MKNEIIFYSHLGLGDQIICVGLVNFLSKKYSKVYVPTKSHYYDMMLYCYKDNPNVEVFKINNEPSDVFDLSKKLNLEIIYAGHGQGKTIGQEGDLGGRIWNVGFYECNGVDYSVSFDYFRLPKQGKEDQKLFNHLMNLYSVSGDYSVVSNEYSKGHYDLNVQTKYPIVYIKQSENIYGNIFLLKKVLTEAKELHLVSSAILHLAERLPIKGDLHYYNVRNGDPIAFHKPNNIIMH